MRIFIHR